MAVIFKKNIFWGGHDFESNYEVCTRVCTYLCVCVCVYVFVGEGEEEG